MSDITTRETAAPPSAPEPDRPRLFTVYLRANEPRNEGQPSYRQAICVENEAFETFGEVLDFPVLRRTVCALNVTHARERFLEWQRFGHDDAWLLQFQAVQS